MDYVPLATIKAEFLFQVIARHSERTTLIVSATCHPRDGCKPIPIRDLKSIAGSHHRPSLFIKAGMWTKSGCQINSTHLLVIHTASGISEFSGWHGLQASAKL